MELKEGYKQTDHGVIPETWTLTKLSSIVTFFNGKAHENFISEFGIFIVVNSKFISTDGKVAKHSLRNNCDLTKNDITIVMSDIPNGKALAKCFIIDKNNTYALNQRIGGLRSLGSIPKYLYYQLNRNKYFLSFDSGSGQTNLRRQEVLDCPVLLPSIHEQTAIATALSDIDALIAQTKKLIAKKKAIKQGVMQRFFSKTGADGKPKKGWITQPFREVAYMKGRIGWQGLKQSEFTMNHEQPFLITGMNFKDGAIRWNEVYHVSEERYELAKEIQLQQGDVLFTKDGTIGKLLFVSEIPYPYKATLNSHLLVFRPLDGKYISRFLYYQLASRLFRDFIELRKTGTTFFGLSQSAVGDYELYLPEISEQMFIADSLEMIDKDIEIQEKQLSKIKMLKQGMIQNLLTGKIRIYKPQHEHAATI